MQLEQLVHGRGGIVLRSAGASRGGRLCGRVLAQLVGVQVSADVRLRVEDGKWRGEYSTWDPCCVLTQCPSQRMWNVVINRLLAGVVLMQCIMILSKNLRDV